MPPTQILMGLKVADDEFNSYSFFKNNSKYHVILLNWIKSDIKYLIIKFTTFNLGKHLGGVQIQVYRGPNLW